MTPLLGTAVFIGAAMLFSRYFFGEQYPALATSLLHGIFALVGIVILWITLAHHSNRTEILGPFILLVVAAVGGFILSLGFHARHKALPKSLMWAHGILALGAFIWLLS